MWPLLCNLPTSDSKQTHILKPTGEISVTDLELFLLGSFRILFYYPTYLAVPGLDFDKLALRASPPTPRLGAGDRGLQQKHLQALLMSSNNQTPAPAKVSPARILVQPQ